MAGKRRFRWYYLIPCFMFLVGLGIFIYPYLTNLQYNGEVERQKETFKLAIEGNNNLLSENLYQEPNEENEHLYTERQDELTNSLEDLYQNIEEGNEHLYAERQDKLAPLEELYQKLQEENERLYTERQNKLTDAWAYEQVGIKLSEYGLEDNIIGFIKIDKMDIELPILLGANKENMKLGAVHLTETSYPIGGNNTNCVIAAHRGYSGAAMFRHIEKLELGDEVVIENFRERLLYEVSEIRIISPDDVEELLIQDGRDLVTLITCHPYTKNYQRYVVFCERK